MYCTIARFIDISILQLCVCVCVHSPRTSVPFVIYFFLFGYLFFHLRQTTQWGVVAFSTVRYRCCVYSLFKNVYQIGNHNQGLTRAPTIAKFSLKLHELSLIFQPFQYSDISFKRFPKEFHNVCKCPQLVFVTLLSTAMNTKDGWRHKNQGRAK